MAIAVAFMINVTASSSLSEVFAGRRAPVVAALAGAGAVVVGLVLQRLDVQGAATVAGHVIAFAVVIGVGLNVSNWPGAGVLRAVWDGATVGWLDLTRIETPATATAHLLTPIALISWASMAVVVGIVMQTRWAPLGVIPLGLALAGFASLGAPFAREIAVSLGVAGLAALYLFLTGASTPILPRSARSAALRSMAGMPVVLLLASLCAVGASQLISDEERFDIRRGKTPPVELQDGTTPLAALKPQLVAEEPEVLFSIRSVDGEAMPDAVFIRQVALDDYDGTFWRSSTAYPIADSQLGADSSSAGSLATFEVQTTSAYRTQYLPLIGDPTSVDTRDAGFARASDSMVLPERAADTAYRFSTRLMPELSEVAAGGELSAAGASSRFLELPDAKVPVVLEQMLEQLDAPAGSVERLVQLQALTTSTFGYSTLAPSGHSLASLADFAGEERADGFSSQVGYAEQSAALFALLARADGYPTRLAVGYRVTDLGEAPTGSIDVTEHDAWAWPEVFMGEGNWITVEATPSRETEVDPPQDPITSEANEVIQQSAPIQLPDYLDELAGDAGAARGEIRLVGLSVLGGLALAGPYLAKLVRRRRRTAGVSPAHIVLGYWKEVRDRLREVGVPIVDAMTPHEVVHAAESHLDGGDFPALRALASWADQALYLPETIEVASVDDVADIERGCVDEINDVVGRRRQFVGRVGTGGLVRVPSAAGRRLEMVG